MRVVGAAGDSGGAVREGGFFWDFSSAQKQEIPKKTPASRMMTPFFRFTMEGYWEFFKINQVFLNVSSFLSLDFYSGAGYGGKMTRARDPRIKQVVWAVAFFVVLTTVVVCAQVGWRHVPGLLGEWLGIMVGVMSSPFFLEGTFVVIGFLTVLSLNIWRRHKEGDEFVYLDQVTGPDVPANLPDTAKWAIYYTQAPMQGVEPSRLELAEGALAIGDYKALSGYLSEMSSDELKETPVMKLRIRLARATGHVELAERLADELR
ncbi:MAG: hypothetical protein QM680_01945 [Luteolibacter sp.]